MSAQLERYLPRIQQAFPQMEIVSARVNSDGLVNDAVIVNSELVFRFPKAEGARELLTYEVAVLRVVAQHVSTPVPVVEYQADDMVMYRYIGGAPLYRHTLLRASDAVQDAIAHELARFLGELHAIPLAACPPPPWQRDGPPTSRRDIYLGLLRAVEEHVSPLLWADQRSWIADLFAPVQNGSIDLDGYAPAFIHRDLASYHILHDPAAGRLTGVIDFGTAGAGDPASDLALLLNTYGEGLLRRMHRVAPIAPELLDRARFLAGVLELEWAVNGMRCDDRSWLLVHLGRARDALPIGVPW